MSRLIYSPMEWFIRHPSLACLIALVFAVAILHLRLRRTRSRTAVAAPAAAACIWCAYAIYEWMILPEMNIRVDLLMIAPLVWLASAVGVAGYVVGLARPGPGRGFPVQGESAAA